MNCIDPQKTTVTDAQDSPHPEAEHPAPLRYRFAAMLYDALIVLGLWVLTIVLLVTITGDAVLGAWVQSMLFLELYAFFALSWVYRGQTLGMLAWRLELRGAEPFTPGRALRRFLGAMAGFATLGLGYFWMWFDRDKYTWADRWSGSTVVRVHRPARGSKAPRQRGAKARPRQSSTGRSE